MSVDVTLPTPRESDPNRNRDYLIPVAMVTKRVLSRVDFEDETGRALPALNVELERDVVYGLLRALWVSSLVATGEEAAKIEQELSDGALKFLEELVCADDAETAQPWLERFRSSGWELTVTSGARRLIAQFAELLAGHGVLFAVLQDVRPGSRHIVKVCFDDTTPTASTPRRPGRHPLIAVGRASAYVLRRLGWLATRIAWNVPGARDAESYHVEVEAPDGLLFVDAYLSAEMSTRRGAHSRRQRLTPIPPGDSRAHLYVKPHRDEEKLVVDLLLLPDPFGWSLAAALTATAVAFGVLAVSHELTQLQRLGNQSAVAGAFLGAGAIAVVYLARPQPSRLTNRLLLFSKFILIVNAASAALVMALLLFATPPSLTGDEAASRNVQAGLAEPTVAPGATATAVHGRAVTENRPLAKPGSVATESNRATFSDGERVQDRLGRWLTRNREWIAVIAVISALWTWFPVVAWPLHRLVLRVGFSVAIAIGSAVAAAASTSALFWLRSRL